jgi:hypothetical protein
VSDRTSISVVLKVWEDTFTDYVQTTMQLSLPEALILLGQQRLKFCGKSYTAQSIVTSWNERGIQRVDLELYPSSREFP